jgi:hypothetical protein
VASVLTVSPVARTASGRPGLLPPAHRAERRLEAAYPARLSSSAPAATDVVDAEVLWEQVDGGSPEWAGGASPFSFARSAAELVRGYGAYPRATTGRIVDLLV